VPDQRKLLRLIFPRILELNEAILVRSQIEVGLIRVNLLRLVFPRGLEVNDLIVVRRM
jgi:hypothetical protein